MNGRTAAGRRRSDHRRSRRGAWGARRRCNERRPEEGFLLVILSGRSSESTRSGCPRQQDRARSVSHDIGRDRQVHEAGWSGTAPQSDSVGRRNSRDPPCRSSNRMAMIRSPRPSRLPGRPPTVRPGDRGGVMAAGHDARHGIHAGGAGPDARVLARDNPRGPEVLGMIATVARARRPPMRTAGPIIGAAKSALRGADGRMVPASPIIAAQHFNLSRLSTRPMRLVSPM